MSYLENIHITDGGSAGFSLKSLDVPRLQNLYIPVGLVGNLAKSCDNKKSGGGIKIPVPLSNDLQTVLGGAIPDNVFHHFQSQTTGGKE